jgi:TRAP-type C4-dicarboxylate transport system permease small subunit
MATPAPSDAASGPGPEEPDDDRPVALGDYGPEDYVVLVVFWVLAGVVFLQFFTRYVLNDSIGWTEEIARFLLITVGFVGAVIAVRRQSHIRVEFLYRYMPPRLRRAALLVIDVGQVAFFAWGTWLAWQVFQLTKRQNMVSLDISKGWIYGTVVVAFAVMAVRAAVLVVQRLRGRVEPGGPGELPGDKPVTD